MPYLFRKKRKDGSYSPRWSFRYRDHEGRKCKGTGSESKAETLRLANKVQADQAANRNGFVPAPKRSEKAWPFAEVSASYLAWGESSRGRPEKTRLIEFGCFAAANRKRRGERRPESFDFLGLTHYCGRKRSGGFLVRRKTMAKRLRSRLRMVKEELMRRRHDPIPDQGRWLRAVVQGYLNYQAIPGNWAAIKALRTQTARLWRHALKRRSQRQRHRLTWERFGPIVERWLPRAKILHPYPNMRFFATHPR